MDESRKQAYYRQVHQEHLRERRAQIRREEELVESEILRQEIEQTTEYRIGFAIGVLVIVALSPIFLAVGIFLAFTGGAPLFVLRFLADADQWKPRGRR